MTHVQFLKSDDITLNKRALGMLVELDNITITLMPFDKVFKERFDLPFIQIGESWFAHEAKKNKEEGGRYFGISGIERFVKEKGRA